jgi:hypothetical protein
MGRELLAEDRAVLTDFRNFFVLSALALFLCSTHSLGQKSVIAESVVALSFEQGVYSHGSCVVVAESNRKILLQMPPVTLGADFQVDLVLTNALGMDLKSLSVKASCGCLTTKLSDVSVLAGSDLKLSLAVKAASANYSIKVLLLGDSGAGATEVCEFQLQGECIKSFDFKQLTFRRDKAEVNPILTLEAKVSKDISDVEIDGVAIYVGKQRCKLSDVLWARDDRKLTFNVDVKSVVFEEGIEGMLIRVPFVLNSKGEKRYFEATLSFVDNSVSYFHPDRIRFVRKGGQWIARSILHCSELANMEDFNEKSVICYKSNLKGSGRIAVTNFKVAFKRLSDESALVTFTSADGDPISSGETGVFSILNVDETELVSVSWFSES